jgi:uncharacterized membrane protein YgdD (TMEM256/DUF423 family)
MSRNARPLLASGAFLMALATIIGALGTHSLRTHLPPDRYEVLQTAVHYQFFHSLGLLAIGLIADRQPGRVIHLAGWLVVVGVVLFSGSLYALVAGAPKLVGVATPVGGLCLIVGWLAAGFAMYRRGD